MVRSSSPAAAASSVDAETLHAIRYGGATKNTIRFIQEESGTGGVELQGGVEATAAAMHALVEYRLKHALTHAKLDTKKEHPSNIREKHWNASIAGTAFASRALITKKGKEVLTSSDAIRKKELSEKHKAEREAKKQQKKDKDGDEEMKDGDDGSEEEEEEKKSESESEEQEEEEEEEEDEDDEEEEKKKTAAPKASTRVKTRK